MTHPPARGGDSLRKRYSLTVRGRHHTWSFTIDAPPEHVADWRADGLEVDELLNTVPEWAVRAGLLRVWVFVQDCFYWRKPFGS